MNMGPEFDDFIRGIGEELEMLGGKPKMVKYLLRKYYFRIKTAFYEDENPQGLINIMKNQMYESVKSNEILTEGSKMDKPTRDVVRDLLNVIKKGPGEYYLPEELVGDEMSYIYNNLPAFSVEITVKEDMSIKGDYLMNAQTADDGDIIEIVLIKNPTKFPEAYFDLVADLNDTVRHELEHVLQDFGYRDVQFDDSEKPNDKEYYKQVHEVPAEIAGFRRIVKLRRQSPEQVIRDWFNRNKEVHQLPDEDIEELVLYLTDEYKKKYG
jgi:hypothetical protein